MAASLFLNKVPSKAFPNPIQHIVLIFCINGMILRPS